MKLVEKIILFMKENPYEAKKLFSQAYKHQKVWGLLTAEFLWSHLSVKNREIIKARAEEEKNRILERKRSIVQAKKEAILVNQNVSDIIEKLHLGKVNHAGLESIRPISWWVGLLLKLSLVKRCYKYQIHNYS